MQLLDIISPGGHHPIKPIILEPDTIKVPVNDSATVKEVIDIYAPHQSADSTLTDSTILDTLKSGIDFLTGMGNHGNSSTALWGIFFTLVALGLCFYFVWTYRKKLAINH